MDINHLKGKTIALEGIDASGKASLSKYLYDLLGHQGLNVKVFEYVNNVQIAKPIRDLMFKSGVLISEKSREFLYSAIASQTLDLATQYRKNNPDSFIIFDRCVISMMAFQALSNNNSDDLKTISLLYSALCDYDTEKANNSIGTKIDDIFYIRISAETSLARCPKGCDYEPGLEKLNRVIIAYDDIFDYNENLSDCTGSLYELFNYTRLRKVNGELSVEEIGQNVLNRLK